MKLVVLLIALALVIMLFGRRSLIHSLKQKDSRQHDTVKGDSNDDIRHN